MAKGLTVIQGDQYAIPFPVYLGGELITPDNCDGVRIKIGNTLHEHPGTLDWDGDNQVWAFPLTEELSRSWGGAQQKAQVGVKVDGSDFHYCPTFSIAIGGNIIEETWGNE